VKEGIAEAIRKKLRGLDTWKFICPKCGKTSDTFCEVYTSSAVDTVKFAVEKDKLVETTRDVGDSPDPELDHNECPECGAKLTDRQIVAGAKKWLKTPETPEHEEA